MSKNTEDHNKRVERLKKSGLASDKSVNVYSDRSKKILTEKQEKFIKEVTEENERLKFEVNLLKLSLKEGLIIDPF